MSKFSKAEGFKIIIKKAVVFLSTKKEISERENKTVYNSIKNNTIPKNKFNQRMERLGHGKLEDVSEINEEDAEWEHSPRSWAGRMKTIKMSTLPQTTYRFNESRISSSGESRGSRKQGRFAWNRRRARALEKGEHWRRRELQSQPQWPKQRGPGVRADAESNAAESRARERGCTATNSG